MSDIGRKGLGEQVGEKITPDSQKTTGQVITENVTGAVDQVAAVIQPDSEKSTTQGVADTTRSGTNDAESQGKGVVASVQETAGSVVEVAADNLKAGADYISGATTEAKDKAADKTS